MDLASDHSATERSTVDRRSLGSESDGSSLISYRSNVISLGDSHFSDGDGHGQIDPETQANKAIDIAEGSGTWNPATPSRPASLATATSDRYGGETQLLLDAGPAPPDYAQATAQQSLAPFRAGDEDSLYIDDDDPYPNLSRQTLRSKGIKRFLSHHWKQLCLINLAFYGILSTVLLVVGYISRNTSAPRAELLLTDDLYPKEHPVNQQQESFHKSTEQCHFTSYSESYLIGWLDPDNVYFEEKLNSSYYSDHHDSRKVIVTGNIEIRPAPYGQTMPVEGWISYAANDAWQHSWPFTSFSKEAFRIFAGTLSPDASESDSRHQDLRRQPVTQPGEDIVCLDVWVGIYVQTQLYNFTLTTENLNIDIGQFHSHEGWDDSWSFRIRDWSQIHTRGGNITTSYWDARITNVTSETGSIKGWYGLNDELHLGTTSGNIDVKIRQQAAHQQNYFSTHPPGVPANLTTVTGSGSQTLRYFQDLNSLASAERYGWGYPFTLNSVHVSQEGSITVASDGFWEGQIIAKSLSGSLNLTGDKLHRLPPLVDGLASESKNARAKKGAQGSNMTVETHAGNVVVCADEYWVCNDFFQDCEVAWSADALCWQRSKHNSRWPD